MLKLYSNDFTNTLQNSQNNNLHSALKTFDDSTSNQVVFLMIKSLSGFPMEMYTYETAKKNKIGTKENDNGVLFFVSKDDKKMRIEVGYGLEGVLPDALASSILRNEVRPHFRNNNYYKGIASGLSAILAATRGEYKGTEKSKDGEGGIPIQLIFIIVFILFSLFSRKKGGRGGLLYTAAALGGFASGGRSSGGFSGGSFGGFSGGGGGFGGGGASGGW
ncbi:MAG: TPM domain-containing protein [Ignavibacteriae bacterium]|nr:TPM domain-containing protein [Ignavibacteriota bacterium]